MKLNLYDILKHVLNESVSQEQVMNSIQGFTPRVGKNKGITRHKYVKITYDDTINNPHPEDLPEPINGTNPKEVRIIQPYTLGIDKKNGQLSVRAFQLGAPSRRDHKPYWRMFRLDRIVGWDEMKKTFTVPAPGYNPNDKGMSNIIATAEFAEMDDTKLIRQKTQDILNSPKVRNKYSQDYMQNQEKNQPGAIPFANQQKKVNVMTSQPNSQRYKQMANNVTNRFSSDQDKKDYWKQYDLAQNERDNIENEKKRISNQIQNDAIKPNGNRKSGPLKPDDDFDVDNTDYNDEEFK